MQTAAWRWPSLTRGCMGWRRVFAYAETMKMNYRFLFVSIKFHLQTTGKASQIHNQIPFYRWISVEPLLARERSGVDAPLSVRKASWGVIVEPWIVLLPLQRKAASPSLFISLMLQSKISDNSATSHLDGKQMTKFILESQEEVIKVAFSCWFCWIICLFCVNNLFCYHEFL